MNNQPTCPEDEKEKIIKFVQNSIEIDILTGQRPNTDPSHLNFLRGRINANREILYELGALTPIQYYLDNTIWVQVG